MLNKVWDVSGAGFRVALSTSDCALLLTLLTPLQLNQPLPFDVRAGDWRAELHRWTPSLAHAGIEHLTIKFIQASPESMPA